MQERLQEIEGTLARTKQRKNTILYKLAKRREEEEKLARLGLRKLPENPNTVIDLDVVKHVLFSIKQELGDKLAKIRSKSFVDLERDGEALVREKNDEINQLILKRNQWEARKSFLRGGSAVPAPAQKLFFGCARNLPEASSHGKRSRSNDSDGDDEESAAADSSDGSDSDTASDNSTSFTIADPGDQYLEWIRSIGSRETDQALLSTEREAERTMRLTSAPLSRNVQPQVLSTTSFKDTFIIGGKLELPSEDEFKAMEVEKRRRALRDRVAKMKQTTI